jgi:hypothetical protein
MTTATTKVVKEDLTTPATPFEDGSGRVDLTKAGSAPIVFSETTNHFANRGDDPVTALNINIPSINVPTMPGTVRVVRTATNVTNKNYDFAVRTTAPKGSSITVTPDVGRIRPGQSQKFVITIKSNAPSGQYFGSITFNSLLPAVQTPAVHMPVGFFNRQGDVTLTQACAAPSIALNASTTCSVTASNLSTDDATVQMTSSVSSGLDITSATGGTVDRHHDTVTGATTTLVAGTDAVPAIATIDPGETPGGGFLDLVTTFGATPAPIGDEDNQNYSVPAFVFGGKTYTSIGVDSNGYISVGGTSNSTDVQFIPQTLPDPDRPNGVLAPYWTDLDGTGSAGVSVEVLSASDTGPSWIVVQWDVHIVSDTSAAAQRSFQVWIGVNGTEDITYSYADNALNHDAPAANGLTIGVESIHGTEGAQAPAGPPTSSYIVTSTPGTPGGSATISMTVKGTARGNQSVNSEMVTNLIAGTTRVSTPITVTRN